MKYYWFEPENGKLGYGDGRKPRKGITHKIEGPLSLCQNGLHASKNILDATKYAYSSILWEVELGGVILHDDDKSCATSRKYIRKIDAEPVLRKFARMCALDVIHLWKAPKIVKDYLFSGNESLRDAAVDAAWDAAGDAAGDAAWAAAGAAARTAAWAAAGAAARAAAGDAAGDAAWAAAGAAAWTAAGDAARAAQQKRIKKMIHAYYKSGKINPIIRRLK